MHLLLELPVLLVLLAMPVLLVLLAILAIHVLLVVGVFSSVGCAVLRTIQSPASRAPQASSAANDALLAEFASKNCAHLIGEPMCASPLSRPPRFKLPAGQEAHWHALQGMAFLGAAGGIFLGGRCRGFFSPRGAEPNSRGQFLSGRAEVGRSAPFDCTR